MWFLNNARNHPWPMTGNGRHHSTYKMVTTRDGLWHWFHHITPCSDTRTYICCDMTGKSLIIVALVGKTCLKSGTNFWRQIVFWYKSRPQSSILYFYTQYNQHGGFQSGTQGWRASTASDRGMNFFEIHHIPYNIYSRKTSYVGAQKMRYQDLWKISLRSNDYID